MTRKDKAPTTHRQGPDGRTYVVVREKEDEGRQYLRRMKMSVKYIRTKFPIKNILNVIGEPTYKAIAELREAMYAKLATISMTLRGGTKWPHWPTHGRSSLC